MTRIDIRKQKRTITWVDRWTDFASLVKFMFGNSAKIFSPLRKIVAADRLVERLRRARKWLERLSRNVAKTSFENEADRRWEK
jgi:hypothetical protein